MRWLFLCGVLAPLVYVATVILGGALDPAYNARAQAISELIATGAPHKTLLDALFCLYNLLTVLAGLGFSLQARASGSTNGMVGGALLVFIGLAGLLLTLFFPMDPRGAPATPAGATHLVLAGLISLGTMAAILFAGLWLRTLPGLPGLAVYSFASLAVVFISGLLAAAGAAQGSPILGLLERVTIGAFLQWLLVISLRLGLA